MKENINVVKIEEYRLEIPIVLLFGETMGYISKYLELASKWCSGKIPAQHIQKVMRIEALDMVDRMVRDYGRETVIEKYRTVMGTILKEQYENLLKLIGEKSPYEVTKVSSEVVSD